MENSNDKMGQKYYGAVWLEFFLSFIGARALQYTYFPDTSLVIILPILFLIAHFLMGRFFSKAENKVLPGMDRLDDLFGTKKK
jgi:hypothetical protein